MGALITALGQFLVRSSLAQFLAFKLILFTLLAVIFPVVLWNFGLEFTAAIVRYAITKLQTDVGQNTTFSLTGLSGWIAVQMKLPESLNLVISALSTRLIIQKLLSL